MIGEDIPAQQVTLAGSIAGPNLMSIEKMSNLDEESLRPSDQSTSRQG